MNEMSEIVKQLREAEKLGLLKCSNQTSSLILEKPETVPNKTDIECEENTEFEKLEDDILTPDYGSTKSPSSSDNYEHILFYLDIDGRIIKINQTGLSYSNLREESVLNKFIWDVPELLGKKENSGIQEIFQSVSKGVENANVTGEFIEQSGEKQVFDFSFYPIKEENKIKSILVAGKNNTYFKKIEKELTENKIKFNSLIEYFEVISDTTISIGRKDLFSDVNDIIFQISPNGRISYINSAVEKIAGYFPEKIIGSKLSLLIPKQDWNKLKKQVLSNGGKDLTGGVIDRFETTVRRKDGTLVPAELNAKIIQNKIEIIGKRDQIRVQGSIRDITERKKAEEERLRYAEKLREINEHLKKANVELEATQNELKILNEGLEHKVVQRTAEIEKLLKHKDEFIGQLGHDLKSPLTPLVGLLPYAEQEEKDPKIKEILSIANRNVGYMKDLVTKTLQLEKLSMPNFELFVEKFNLFDLVGKITENKQFNYGEKGIKVFNEINKNMDVIADKIQFEELIDNLFTNAIKFTSNGGVITLNAKKKDDFTVVSINDTGIGLASEHMEHIFEEFYKVDPSRHDLESSGLGLSICKRIVEKHGGKIWVESPGLGKGSTFYFTIPDKK
jgi:PAS domain S-box-containing protein